MAAETRDTAALSASYRVWARIIGFFSTFDLKKGLLFSFVLGVGLRVIPEVLAFPYPISWDSVHYAVFMRTGIVWPHWSSFFTSTWLLYAFLFPLHTQLGLDSFMLLKITGPLLYGLNVAGIYWLAKTLLNWSSKDSLAAAAFFSVQLAPLGISWGFLRNLLGLGLLLFTLPLLKRLNSKRGLACFVALSLLTVFAHEYSAVTLLVICLLFSFLGFLKRGGECYIRLSKRLLIAVTPALTVFLIGLFLRMFPIAFERPPNAGPNMVWVKDTTQQVWGKLFFFVNYLGMDTGLDIYPNYVYLAASVIALFAVLYISYFYLARRGFFRNSVLDLWTALLLFSSFGCLVIPFFALQYWHRWMFMLAYPLTFYAVVGARALLGQVPQTKVAFHRFGRFKAKVFAMVSATVMLGAVYLATPALMTYVGFGSYSLPTSRYFSAAPTVRYQDINGTIHAIQWLDVHMDNESCAVLQNAFATWATLYLGSSHNVVAYINNVSAAVDYALQAEYDHIYFVGWNEDFSWYGVYVPEHFVQLDAFDTISVYEFVAG